MAFRPTRSLTRSPPKDVKEGASSTSEMDTQAEVSESGSEVTGVRERIRVKAIVNRAGPENNEEEEDNIVIKLSEWRAMT